MKVPLTLLVLLPALASQALTNGGNTLTVQPGAVLYGAGTVQNKAACTLRLGQPLGQQQLHLSAGATALPLAITSGLATGIYLLHVQQGSQQQTLKLVRQ